MAEITGFTGKRRSPRIDMTAMVDVAFLLLTFFVLTATLSTAKMMKMTMPIDNATSDISAEKVMTMTLCAGNWIEYYVGLDSTNANRVTSEHIRAAIQAHLQQFSPICKEEMAKDCWDPIFLIKSKDDANYGTLVDVLDELSILGAKKYAIDQP